MATARPTPVVIIASQISSARVWASTFPPAFDYHEGFDHAGDGAKEPQQRCCIAEDARVRRPNSIRCSSWERTLVPTPCRSFTPSRSASTMAWMILAWQSPCFPGFRRFFFSQAICAFLQSLKYSGLALNIGKVAYFNCNTSLSGQNSTQRPYSVQSSKVTSRFSISVWISVISIGQALAQIPHFSQRGVAFLPAVTAPVF